MDDNALVNEVSSKYGYSEELQIAIRLTLPLMVNRYGEEHINEICDLFRNTRIFATEDMSARNMQRIEDEMLNGANSHLVIDEGEDPYLTGTDPGSYYSYQAIYDEDINVVDEVRWVVVKDMKDSFNGPQYKEMFGTTINMPYFIHEMNHAFAAQNAIYRKEGDRIYSKHGMFEEERVILLDGEKPVVKTDVQNNIIIEEAVNDKITQDMLVELMQVSEYSEVVGMLQEINHVSTSYTPVLITLAEKLENVLGKKTLLDWRRDNDTSVLDEFNKKASQSDIATKYCDGQTPYDYFDRKCFGIFQARWNAYKMSVEEYAMRSRELMVEAFAPLCAYQDIRHGTMSIDKFNSIREGILGIEVNNQKTNTIDEGPVAK